MRRLKTLVALIALTLGLITLAYAAYLGVMPGIMETIIRSSTSY